jgi:hypothetical protein
VLADGKVIGHAGDVIAEWSPEMANWVQFKTTENGEQKAWLNLDLAEMIRAAPAPYKYATEVTIGGQTHLVFEKPETVVAHASGSANA